MKIFQLGENLSKPKNYSRKGKICSCQCCVICADLSSMDIDRVMVKYEIEPNKDSSPIIKKLRKNQWSSYSHWGEFKRVIELPKIFDKLQENDFVVKTGFFTRDDIQVPFICEISIINHKKYKMLKQQMQRKEKLNKIKNL